GGGLIEAPAARGEEDDRAAVVPAFRPDRFESAEDRLRLHDHARAAPEGSVVHRAMLVVRVLAQIVNPDLHDPRLAGPLNDPVREGSLHHAGEDGEHVEPHHGLPVPRASNSSGLTGTRRPAARSTRLTKESARGIRISPCAPRTTGTVASPPVSIRSATVPRTAPPGSSTWRPRSWWWYYEPAGRGARSSSAMRSSRPRYRSASSMESTPSSFSTNRPLCGQQEVTRTSRAPPSGPGPPGPPVAPGPAGHSRSARGRRPGLGPPRGTARK